MLRVIRQWISDALGFSKSEANGTITLFVLAFLGLVVPKVYLYQTKSSANNFQLDKESLKSWAAELESSFVLKPKPKPKNEPPPLEQFPFNPNSATLSEMIRLGLGEYASKNILSYREKGGRFMVKKDLLRIYNIPEERVKVLWNYIQLPDELKEPEEIRPYDKPAQAAEPIKKFEVNTATPEDLRQLKGIGPVLSKRIVSYRNKLGGFHQPEQLYEVYGLDSAVVNQLRQHLIFASDVQQIDLNTDSLKHLYRHPYIDYNTAKVIVNFRKQRGQLDDVEQLKSIKIISDSLYQKIYPYLSPNP
ncbi:ComEA family DNA-binding protein [Marinoscillum furvescens]|uniref:Competence ComEA-like helix-hairpin-helix protein n=1 Tax=Marinoscillum furvescens DSM 4134 TaxID=1122208 RepID=A0A3D9L379_MARFU|nr:helix-hairpin-helix domain-containing protein [Marinoscillum furvescens]RED99736.1 competence ComEA-like helix-hairpin-helix protein [Marinoscillum furvescens DSM 4134]